MELQSDGFGFLRSADSDYQPSPDDIYVSPSQCGASTSAPATPSTAPSASRARRALLRPAEGGQGQLRRPDQQRGEGPDPLRQPHPLYPTREAEPRVRRVGDDDPHHRPLHPHRLGQRCLIVARPRRARRCSSRTSPTPSPRNHPDIFLIVLLVDERPRKSRTWSAASGASGEQHLRRAGHRHVQVAEMVIDKAKRCRAEARRLHPPRLHHPPGAGPTTPWSPLRGRSFRVV